MGTAGPIGLAAQKLLENNKHGFFFVVNSDIVCQYEFQKMLDKHQSHNGEVTICVKDVQDPSKFGVVQADDNGRVE